MLAARLGIKSNNNPDSRLRIQDSGFKTQDSRPRIQDPGFNTQDSTPRSQAPGFNTPDLTEREHHKSTRDKFAGAFVIIACARGFEPPTFWSVAKRSIQLSYAHVFIYISAYACLDDALKYIIRNITRQAVLSAYGFGHFGIWGQYAPYSLEMSLSPS